MSSLRTRLKRVVTGRAFAPSIVALVGILLTTLTLDVLVDADRHQAEHDLEQQALAGHARLEHLVDNTADRLTAVGGLFRASEYVSGEEFDQFVDDVGFNAGMSGVGFVAAVPGHELGPFLTMAAAEHGSFAPFEVDEKLEPTPLDPRPIHHLVLYAEPVADHTGIIGMDLAAHPTSNAAIAEAATTGEAAASALFQMPGETDDDGFLIVQPLPRVAGQTPGYAVALMDMSDLLGDGMSLAVGTGIEWEIHDVTDEPVAAHAEWTGMIEAAGRRWQLELDSDQGFTPWTVVRILGLLLGVLVSLGAAVLVAVLIERRRSRRELARLGELSRQKDRFLAFVSHELRTPLTAVLGFLGELRERWDSLSDAERSEMLAIADDGAHEMASLVADLLVRERMVSGSPLSVSLTEVDVAATVRWVTERLSGGLEVTVRVGGDGTVLADPLRLRQILRNLLDNVTKHARGPVVVTVTREGGECRIAVEDSGDGVPECCVPTLFDLDDARASHGHPVRSDSHGLGLPVSRFLADAMGGELRYEAEQQAFVLVLEAVPHLAVVPPAAA